MKKSDRIEAETGGPHSGELAEHPCYLGWFKHFNAGRYYEAHDVLEHLWLRTPGAHAAFFKGLIQLAGAFVHLRKQSEHPTHPKHGRRLRPAARLFALAAQNLAPYAPSYLGLRVLEVEDFCQHWQEALAAGEYETNPWNPNHLPILQAPAQ